MGKHTGQECLLTPCRLRQHSFEIDYLDSKKKCCLTLIVLPLILNTDSKVPLVWNELTTKASTAWNFLYRLPENTDTNYIGLLLAFFSCRDPFACTPSFSRGETEVPKKSSCGPSWSLIKKPKHHAIIQWHITSRTYWAGQQGRQNAEWIEFAHSGFVGGYLLPTTLVNPLKVHRVLLCTDKPSVCSFAFCFASRASHLSETTKRRHVTCWGSFSGSPSLSSLLQTIVTSSSRKLVTGGPLVDTVCFLKRTTLQKGSSRPRLSP